jgi:hypothetical protein
MPKTMLIRFIVTLGGALSPSLTLAQPSALPTLNVRLRHICLSIADNLTGEIKVSRVDQLPDSYVEPSLRVTETWAPSSNRAEATISDGEGVELRISQTISSVVKCDPNTLNKFSFRRRGKGYSSELCISYSDKDAQAVKVSMELSGQSDTGIDHLKSLVLAIASCYQPRRLNAEYNGFVIGREIVRTEN